MASAILSNLRTVGFLGELVFEHGEAVKHIEVEIVDDDVYEKDESFLVCITDITGGAIFDATTDGSEDSCICEVTIVSDEETKKLADRVLMTMHIDRHKLTIGSASWAEQFKMAMSVSSDDSHKRSTNPTIVSFFTKGKLLK